jgi:hypothetical protein
MLSIPDHVRPVLFEMAALAVVYRQEKSVTAILWEEKKIQRIIASGRCMWSRPWDSTTTRIISKRKVPIRKAALTGPSFLSKA